MENSKYSCTKRDKEKCVEESSTVCGRMCVNPVLIPDELLEDLYPDDKQDKSMTKNIDAVDWELWGGVYDFR